MLSVEPSVKRGWKWVDREIDRLDPNVDYARIMGLVAEYQGNDFSLLLGLTNTLLHTTLPATGSETILFTSKQIRRPQARNQDSLDFFWTWFGNGPDHPQAIEAVQRLNKIHLGIAQHLPGHFPNDDFVYTFCLVATGQHRLLTRLGLVGVSPKLKIASHRFIKELSKHFIGEEQQPITGVPDSFEAMLAFADRYEALPHPYNPLQTKMAEAIIHNFGTTLFPRPLQTFGRWMLLATLPEHIAAHHRITPIRGLPRMITRAVLKALFVAQGTILPDSKVSAIERRKLKSREELKQLDRQSAATADAFGWPKGGKDVVGHRESPASAFSFCPVLHNEMDSSLGTNHPAREH